MPVVLTTERPSSRMSTIALSGSIAQRPGRAGHAWVFLSYLLGLRALGHDVLFIDRLERDMVERGGWSNRSASREARWLISLMEGAGLSQAFALLLGDGLETIGLSRDRLLKRLRECTLLLNFNGFLGDKELLDAVPERVYVDLDPGFAQMWEELGLAEMLDGHDQFVSVGWNVGRPDCGVPSVGRRWLGTRQPVLLDHWPRSPRGDTFTSIGSWRGPFEPVEYQGGTYGLRVHEFRHFSDLPLRVDAPFELALDIEPADGSDLQLLLEGGWRLVDPLAALDDLYSYRAYIQSSMAEVSIAKNMYVKTRSGWFSDRSATYLASGKPVLAQDTGFGGSLPTGKGLLKFSCIDEAAEGAEAIRSDWGRHSIAARRIAEEHFEASKVLTRLLTKLGATA